MSEQEIVAKIAELEKKALEEKWTEKQFRDALQVAGIELPEESELPEEVLDQVAGGVDRATCPHKNLGYRTKIYSIAPGKNDWGYHVVRKKYYTCKDCGLQYWDGERPK